MTYKFVDVEVSWNRSNETFFISGMALLLLSDFFGFSDTMGPEFRVNSKSLFISGMFCLVLFPGLSDDLFESLLSISSYQ